MLWLGLKGESILVVVAGPSASGKTTFIDQITRRKQSPLADKALQSLGVASGISFRTLGANIARKSIKRGEILSESYRYQILHLDLTSRSRGKHLKFCPIIFSQFMSIYSIQIYLPYSEWLNRIRLRIATGESVSDRAQNLLDYTENDYRLGERLYRKLYTRWENYLDLRRVRSRVTIDTASKTVFKKPPAEIRRNLIGRAVYSAICCRPSLIA
ncbi:hypothetical protein [Synechococcus sp. MIT S1220]|uniref:hypothetical protein n=1 Tax=Synechococcus sp. MIT S1220 TaxID=3082549 RepID=UPI0039AEB6D5